MAEYIEREASLKAILDLPPKMDEQGYGWLGRRGVWQMLLDFPAADVQPVRHGRWFMRGGKWRCSECDQKALLRLSDATGGCREYEYYRANYCPNCGAKMEGIE